MHNGLNSVDWRRSLKEETSCCSNLKPKTLREALVTSHEEGGLMAPFFACTYLWNHLYSVTLSLCGCKTCHLNAPAWIKCSIILLSFLHLLCPLCLHKSQDIRLFIADQRKAVPAGCDGGSRFLLLPEWFPAGTLPAALHPIWWWMVGWLSFSKWWEKYLFFALKTFEKWKCTIFIGLINCKHFKLWTFSRFTSVFHWNGNQHTQWLYPAQLEETRGSSLQDSWRSKTEITLNWKEAYYLLCACTNLWSSLSSVGGLFEYVSGANYFGEIVEWFGYAVATWSFPALSFAVFSLCFIGPRAYYHHRCLSNIQKTEAVLTWHEFTITMFYFWVTHSIFCSSVTGFTERNSKTIQSCERLWFHSSSEKKAPGCHLVRKDDDWTNSRRQEKEYALILVYFKPK